LTSTRILARRRLGATAPAPHVSTPPRRRRRTRGFVQVAGAVAAERLRLNLFGHAYMAIGAGVIVLLFYLAIAAQITQASYDISRLQDQQRQLIAEQDQLRYQEVTLHAPAQVQQQAAQSGMQRIVPSSYVQGSEVAIDLTAPVGASPTDTTPLWLRAVALVVNTVGGTRDVQAATKK
jgi:predicted lipid-binding transport protein (Tim44 family)